MLSCLSIQIQNHEKKLQLNSHSTQGSQWNLADRYVHFGEAVLVAKIGDTRILENNIWYEMKLFHITFDWMKASTWESGCLQSDCQRGSKASVFHWETCAASSRHQLCDPRVAPNSSLLSWTLPRSELRHSCCRSSCSSPWSLRCCPCQALTSPLDQK